MCSGSIFVFVGIFWSSAVERESGDYVKGDKWKFQIRILLQASELMGHVDGTIKEPLVLEHTKKEDCDAWTKANSNWTKLESIYGTKSKVTSHLIHKRFFNI